MKFEFANNEHLDAHNETGAAAELFQQAYDIVATFYRRRFDVNASHRRQYDVILASCAGWVHLGLFSRSVGSLYIVILFMNGVRKCTGLK